MTGRPTAEAGRWSMGRRIPSEDAEGGRVAPLGQGGTVGRSPHRQRVPDLPGWRPPAHRPEEERALAGARECGSASPRGARCGQTARRERCGGRRVTGVPTATANRKATYYTFGESDSKSP